MTNRASENLLASLHNRVAETMLEALEQSNVATDLLNKDRDYPLPHDVIKFLTECQEVNPSLLTAALALLHFFTL